MNDIRKLARIYVWSGAVFRVLQGAAPIVLCVAVAFGDVSVSVQGV